MYRVTFLKLETCPTPRLSAEGSGTCAHRRGATLSCAEGEGPGEVGGAGQRQRASIKGWQVAKTLEPHLLTVTKLCHLKGLQRGTCKGQHDTH